MSTIEKQEQENRINNFKRLYEEYNALTDENEISNAILSNSKNIHIDTDSNLIVNILNCKTVEELSKYKDEVLKLYKDNKVEYCFISYSDFLENYIDKIQGTTNPTIDDFEKLQLYYNFISHIGFYLPEFGYNVLSALLKDKAGISTDDSNTKSDSTDNSSNSHKHMELLKIEYDRLLTQLDGNCKSEIELYGSYIKTS